MRFLLIISMAFSHFSSTSATTVHFLCTGNEIIPKDEIISKDKEDIIGQSSYFDETIAQIEKTETDIRIVLPYTDGDVFLKILSYQASITKDRGIDLLKSNNPSLMLLNELLTQIYLLCFNNLGSHIAKNIADSNFSILDGNSNLESIVRLATVINVLAMRSDESGWPIDILNSLVKYVTHPAPNDNRKLLSIFKGIFSNDTVLGRALAHQGIYSACPKRDRPQVAFECPLEVAKTDIAVQKNPGSKKKRRKTKASRST